MKTLETIAEILARFHLADDFLQSAFVALRDRYFSFLQPAKAHGTYHGTRHLRLRFQRDADGRIRRIAWTKRIKPTLTVDGKIKYLTRQLRGPFRRSWVFHIAKDWARVADYQRFADEIASLNALRVQLLNARLRTRLAIENAWAPKASPEDLRRAEELVAAQASALRTRDVRPLVGAAALARELETLEAELGRLIDEWRHTFAENITFEPALRPNPNGTVRLYWGFPSHVGDRTFTQYIPGRPTDQWMRKLRVPTRTRKAIAAFQRRLFPFEQRYRKLCGFLGGLHRIAAMATSRVERALVTATAPFAAASPDQLTLFP